jgi:hypothetical protein
MGLRWSNRCCNDWALRVPYVPLRKVGDARESRINGRVSAEEIVIAGSGKLRCHVVGVEVTEATRELQRQRLCMSVWVSLVGAGTARPGPGRWRSGVGASGADRRRV